ncbi:unnamed protein product [Camellia sinensis]
MVLKTAVSLVLKRTNQPRVDSPPPCWGTSFYLLGWEGTIFSTCKTLPPRKKKPISKKKMEMEKLKQGLSALGE